MLDKKEFQQSVMDMKKNPKDRVVQTTYFKHVQHLAEIISKSYRVRELDDMIQELCEYSIIKRLHERIKPGQSPFSYYWKSLANHVWWLKKQKTDDLVRTFDMWENSYSDEGEGEDDMLRKLGFDLDDYNVDSIDEIIDNVETVQITRGKRGRPRTKEEGEKAAHWEYIFKQLKMKKTMTEKALFNQLPDDKKNGLKNVEKSIEYYMRQIARREGLTLSVSNNGTDNVYMIF
jgi:hypothetical protein